MRISDWSSDVCSSDIDRHADRRLKPRVERCVVVDTRAGHADRIEIAARQDRLCAECATPRPAVDADAANIQFGLLRGELLDRRDVVLNADLGKSRKARIAK